MANLKEVKNRISSVTSTQQITSAMKMVAAAKLKRAQDKITQMRPYSQKLTGLLQNVSAGMDDNAENIYGQEREVNNVLLVVISSDRGLCGAFNNNVFKATVALIKEKYADVEQDGGLHILPLGKKSFEYFSKRDYQVIDKYYGLFSNLSFEEAKGTAEEVMKSFVDGKYDRVELVYNEFKNVATQVLQVEQFLPVATLEQPEEETTTFSFTTQEYIYQPSKEFMLEELVPKSLKVQFYKAALESNASEHGARMTAMDQATDNAGEMLKALKLAYNRTRQAAITKEILEIVGGAEALASDG
ncbi:ATP synthase F1 subunit gamma [Reichenbachiella carrageenanivorans]|uniref:ATP synthase gamma chain n=1 Tax=Reichenbachiella carrageenanivorans TaxID=2979869 RepID=A0ABY6D1V0_9BACT|nr:ATP synthase F1 subunit gamma [Reichenbachiella carrageenanivorans]UXX80140.1 ATP synthase F1 subunit gamma [Reichenbachiella carrageenanivorans]